MIFNPADRTATGIGMSSLWAIFMRETSPKEVNLLAPNQY
jgi:hypothetical protein